MLLNEKSLLRKITRPRYIRDEYGDYIYIEGGKSNGNSNGSSTIILDSNLKEKENGKILNNREKFMNGNRISYNISDGDIILVFYYHVAHTSSSVKNRKKYLFSVNSVKFIIDNKTNISKPYFTEILHIYGLFNSKKSLINKLIKKFPKILISEKRKEELTKHIRKLINYAFSVPKDKVVKIGGKNNGEY